MTKEEYDKLMETLENNLSVVTSGLKDTGYYADNTWKKPEEVESHLLDAPTPLDAIEMATRCVSRHERIPKEIKESPEFKERVIRAVMSRVEDIKLNDEKGTMLQAVKYSSIALEYVSDRLKDDVDFILDAVKANPDVAKSDIVQEFCAENPNFSKRIKELSSNRENEFDER